MTMGLFLLEVSFAWSLDENFFFFFLVRNGSRFYDFFFTLFDLKLVVRGVFWPLLMWLCLPVWCGGCCHVSIYLGVLVSEMLVSADKSALCGLFFTRTCAGFNTSGGVRRSSLTECEAWPLWFGAWRSLVLRRCQTVGFYVSLDTCFLGFSRSWPFFGYTLSGFGWLSMVHYCCCHWVTGWLIALWRESISSS